MSKKKILLVRPSLGYGGADRVTVNLVNHFDNNRFDVDLALMKSEGEMKHLVSNQINIVHLNAKSLWVTVIPLIKLLKKTNYDVVYSTCGGMSIPMIIAVKLSQYRGTAVVSERNTLHRTYSSKWKKMLLLGLKKYLFKKADIVTSVSSGIKQELIDVFKLPSDKIEVVNNPLIDNTIFDLSLEPIADKFRGKYVVLSVGRFVKQKDYPNLLEAFARFKKDKEDAILIILGKGPLQSQIMSLAVQLGIEKSVEFMGFDSNPYKYMSKCDLFVLSSLHEGMPGVLIQAMALGAVCISTDCPTGPNEIIKDGENGFLVPVGNPLELAQKMKMISKPGFELGTIKANARNSVSKFNILNGVESYFKFL